MTLPRVGVIGAGRMGRGIALAFAYAGGEVLLLDAKERPAAAADCLREAALAEIAGDLSALAALGVLPPAECAAVLARVHYATRSDAARELPRVEVIFEAVPEVMEAKRQALIFASESLTASTIIASTSSTFLSTEIAAFVPGAARFLNAHWLNPAYLIPLVEISPHPGTDPAVTQRLLDLLRRAGKVPVVCRPAPGYIVPRLQALLMNEAARMIEQGLATAEDIDRATRFGLGPRYAGMGVVEFIDFGGTDILYHASRYLAGALGDERYRCPEIVERHVAEGRLGLKTAEGFYDWRSVDLAGYRKEVLGRLVGLLAQQNLVRRPGSALSP